MIGTPRKPPGGVRRYGTNTLAQLRFIKRARQLGISLREIGDLLELGSGAGACTETRVLAVPGSRLSRHACETCRPCGEPWRA